MKKILIILSIVSSAFLFAQSESVKGAAYAEIRGIPGGWIRIYKTAHSRYNRTANTISKLWKPTLYFFDANGNKVAQEEFAHPDQFDRSAATFNSQNYEKIIGTLQSRLTELPVVHSVGTMRSIKGPGAQWIELFDKKGLLIASLSRIDKHSLNFDELVGLGDALPKKAMDILKDRVCNPEALYFLKISKTRADYQIGLKNLVFKK